MTLNDYQRKALTTALPVSDDLIYRTLGLAGEAAEIANKVKKWMRDKDMKPNASDKKELAGELGDVLWYTATLADCLGFKLDDVAQDNVAKLAKRKAENKLTGSGDKR